MARVAGRSVVFGRQRRPPEVGKAFSEERMMMTLATIMLDDVVLSR